MLKHRRLIGLLVCAGALAAPGPALAGWVYTISNNPEPGKNSVLALQFGANGKLSPAHIREYLTGGTGAPFLGGGKDAGTFGGDEELKLSLDKNLLFAVNQASNTITVFRVNKRTGALKRLSVTNSGGIAPISIGVSKNRIVVANHGQISPFDIGGFLAGTVKPGPSSFVSFSVSSNGKLTKLSTLPAGNTGVTAAQLSPNGRNMFSTGFYGLNIYSATVSGSGALAMAPGSPSHFPASIPAGITLPFFFPQVLVNLPFGVAVHPTKPYVYILAAAASRVATYQYDTAGKLTFLNQVDNKMSVAACWTALSKDARHLYTANSASQNITHFTISADGKTLTWAGVTSLIDKPDPGTVFNLAISANGKFLFAVAGHDDPDGPRPQGVDFAKKTVKPAPADGNFVEAFRIGAGGALTALSSTPLPVRHSQLPYGLQTIG